ncbi:flagellar basal body L-ring protein FlgH [Deferribacterales bacterium RsTz2092]|nr:flagellar L-ring protein [Deferribacterales bacterium]
MDYKRGFRRVLVASIAILAMSCAGKKAGSASSLAPADGYKEELAAYERQKAAGAQSPSLWSDVGGRGTMFLDYKARLVGDVVIVRIVESSTANNSNQTNASRTSNYASGVTNILGLPGSMGITNFLGSGRDFDPNIEATTNNTWGGNGSKEKSDSINATIAARIVGVLPSGNLLIEGRRELVVDQEKQTITIKGVVRQKDIDASNTVVSSAIADAQIAYSGDGVLSDANRKGWLATVIDWIWPF